MSGVKKTTLSVAALAAAAAAGIRGYECLRSVVLARSGRREHPDVDAVDKVTPAASPAVHVSHFAVAAAADAVVVVVAADDDVAL